MLMIFIDVIIGRLKKNLVVGEEESKVFKYVGVEIN
jgi:hypothetical protein